MSPPPHLRHIVEFESPALGHVLPATVLVPSRPAPPQGFSVLYLLHGGFSNHAEWSERLPLTEWAAPYDLVIVTPEGESSMYVNGHDGRRFADAVLDDVPTWAERTLGVRSDREGRAMAGLSMGGFGAMNLGLMQPDRFAALGSLSGAFGMTWWDLGRRPDSPFLPALGPDGSRVRERYHPWRVLEAALHARRSLWPQIGLWVGENDDPDVVSANRAYHLQLEAFRVRHSYVESPGGHDWDYWASVTPELLRFVADALRLERRDG